MDIEDLAASLGEDPRAERLLHAHVQRVHKAGEQADALEQPDHAGAAAAAATGGSFVPGGPTHSISCCSCGEVSHRRCLTACWQGLMCTPPASVRVAACARRHAAHLGEDVWLLAQHV